MPTAHCSPPLEMAQLGSFLRDDLGDLTVLLRSFALVLSGASIHSCQTNGVRKWREPNRRDGVVPVPAIEFLPTRLCNTVVNLTYFIDRDIHLPVSWRGGRQVETTATAKGQIVIPSSIRRRLGIKEGTRIKIEENGREIILKPITREYVHSLRGRFKGKGLMKALMAEKKREREL